MGDLESDLEDLASEISGKDDVLGLDVDLQYVSPQFNRLSPLDAHGIMSPWSRGSFETDRGAHRLSSRLSASPSTNTTPFLRIRSGGSTGSPEAMLTSFLTGESGDSPLIVHPQSNGRQKFIHSNNNNIMNNGIGMGNGYYVSDSPNLNRQTRLMNADPLLQQHMQQQQLQLQQQQLQQQQQQPLQQLQQQLTDSRKPVLMHPPLPRTKSNITSSSSSSSALPPLPSCSSSSSLSSASCASALSLSKQGPPTESPLAMKRVAKKPTSASQLSRQRAPIPPSPTLPRRTQMEPIIRRTGTPTPFFLPGENIGSISPARLQAALCSLQSAALVPPAPKQQNWPGYIHDLPQFVDPALVSSRDLQKLVLRDRDRLPELNSPAISSQASPFVDRSRSHEPRITNALVVTESPGEKKLDRLRRRREIHSAVERRRRDITNNVLNQLSVLVTAKNMPECKMSKSEILQNSVKHILQSHQVLTEFAAELGRLQPNNPLLIQYEAFLDSLVSEEDVMRSAPIKTR